MGVAASLRGRDGGVLDGCAAECFEFAVAMADFRVEARCDVAAARSIWEARNPDIPAESVAVPAPAASRRCGQRSQNQMEQRRDRCRAVLAFWP